MIQLFFFNNTNTHQLDDHLGLTVTITGIMNRVRLQNIEQFSSAYLLILSTKQFMSWEVAMKILLYIISVARIWKRIMRLGAVRLLTVNLLVMTPASSRCFSARDSPSYTWHHTDAARPWLDNSGEFLSDTSPSPSYSSCNKRV